MFSPKAFEQFNEWGARNKHIHRKIIELLSATAREPFTGLGNPEPLKHQLQGHWSRRIDREHRLVYSVSETMIEVKSCRDHYSES